MLNIDDHSIYYCYHGETLQVEASLCGSVRVRAWMNAQMPQGHSALLDVDADPCRTWRTDRAAYLQTGALVVRVSAEGIVGFYRDGTLLLEESACSQAAPEPAWPTRTQRLPLRRRARDWHIGTHGWSLTVRFTSPKDEQLFGMGQYQQGTWNLKGAVLELMQRNSQSSVPFVYSSAGYGFLWNNPAVGQAIFGINETIWFAQATQMMDYWFTVGDCPEKVLHQYADATGHAPQMPEFAIGFWQSKLRYRTQEEVLRVAEEYTRRQIPLSVIIIDFFHWTNLGEWRFDPACFPDPEAMINRLHALGIKLGVSVWPHVAWNSRNHHSLYEQGLLMRTDAGCDLTDTYGGNSTYLDLTHPQAQDYLKQQILQNYERLGVDFYWLDEAEPELPFYDQQIYRYHAGPALEVANLYPLEYARTFADMDAQQGKPVMNLVRCAWAGSQRFGALVWSGDIPCTFTAMKNQLIAALHMGMAGIPWWTMDIGGFRGGNIESEAFCELLLRWFAFGAFCPVMRLHGHREPVCAQEAAKDFLQTGADNEVWSFGEEALQVCTRYIRIRGHLQPYLRRVFHQAHTKGLPVMRPLFLHFWQDAHSWRVDDEYLLGEDLLVAPVCQSGAQKRNVYLPAGSDWVCVWTNQVFCGGQSITSATPMDQIPVYLRKEQADVLCSEMHTDLW